MNIKNIGVSTSAFGYCMGSTGKNTERKNPRPWTLEQFIDFAAENGFGGVEAPLMRFVPDLDTGRIETIKSMLDDRGMFFVMDSEAALDSEQITALMPLAKEFGSPIIRIKSSDILSCARSKLGHPWSEHVEKCISTFKTIAPQLREQGLKIALENHQDLDSNDLMQIISSVGADVVGVTFDIGNAFSVCEDPVLFARKLGRSIVGVHLKEYKLFRSDEGFRLARCPIGEGSVDFKAVLPLIVESSPDAKMVVELGALEARNIGWLTPSFWEEIQPRTQAELVTFFQLLEHQSIRSDDGVWKTPWENGMSGADVTSYEINELEASIKCLSTL